MANCNDLEVSRLGAVRSFLQVPNPNGCTRKTLYYGKDCQFMEVDGVVRNVRNAGTPIRTWDRRTRKWCTIGSTEAPPDNSQFTVRFRIPCGKGIPLPHTVGRCRVRIVNNFGICNSDGAAVSGWSDYAEVIDAWLLTESRGRRSSYDGADDPLTSEWSMELLNVFDISTVSFSEIDLTPAMDTCDPASMRFNNAVFACLNGCGQRECGCDESCDDGTRTFYIPSSCDGGDAQYVMHSTNGEKITGTTILPASQFPTAAATIFPQAAISNNSLYVMAYEAPPSLWELTLDSDGNPQDITELTRLDYTTANTTVDAGVPGSMLVQGSDIHMIVIDAANGDRFYTYSSSRAPRDGARFTFDVAASPVSKLAACGNQMIVGGADGSVYVSEDEGSSWNMITSPTTDQILSTEIADGKYWITTITGTVFYTDNGAAEAEEDWTEIDLPGTTGQINDITFLGDDVGWIVGQDKLVQSTWLGGLDRSDWTNKSQRIYGLPTDLTEILYAAVPECADSDLGANTVLLLGINDAGEYVAYMGRPIISGI